MRILKTSTALGLVLGLTALAQAQNTSVSTQAPVKVAPGHSETQVTATPRGTPIVNIAKPRSDGTSYNVFSRFNVGREGLILNNNPNIGNSVIAGQILANPNLRQGGSSASLIINEVTGGTRSDLSGAIEIFGPRAAFILANPSGITCDGCGFFNVSRATLATGRVTFGADGSFQGFAVDGGDVEIKGQGLFGGDVDYFDIVTGSAKINASLYARDLVIAGGASNFDYYSRTATARPGTVQNLAIDSSLLGGIFTNRIRLIGTGSGVGINLRGSVAALEGNLEINAQGQIAVRNAVAAKDIDVRSSADNITVGERLYAGGSLTLDAGKKVSHLSQFIGANGNVSISGRSGVTIGGTGLYAGLGSDGRFDGTGRVDIVTVGDVSFDRAQIVATTDFDIVGKNIVLGQAALLSANDVNFSANESLLLAGGVQGQGDISLLAPRLDVTGRIATPGSLMLAGNAARVDDDIIALAGVNIDLHGGLSIGTGGTLQSENGLSIVASDLVNKGRLVGVSGVTLDFSGQLTSEGNIISGGNISVDVGKNASIAGVISSNDSLSFRAGEAVNIGGALASVGSLSLAGAEVVLSGALSSGGNISVGSANAITAEAGSIIASDGSVTLDANLGSKFRGYLSAAHDIDLSVAGLAELTGQAHAGNSLSVQADNISIAGLAVSNSDILLSANDDVLVSGSLSAGDELSVSARSLLQGSQSQIIADGLFNIVAGDEILQQGVISAGAVDFAARRLISQGNIVSGGNLAFDVQAGFEQSGAIEASGRVSVSADNIAISGKLLGLDSVGLTSRSAQFSAQADLQSGGRLDIVLAESSILAGNILSVGDAHITGGGDIIQLADLNGGNGLDISAQGLLRNDGNITANGIITLQAADVVGAGDIFGNDLVDITSFANVDLAGGLLSVGTLTVTAVDLVRLGGDVATDGAINFAGRELEIGGAVTSVDGFDFAVSDSVTIGSSGQLRSGADFNLDTGIVHNAGLISATNGLSLTVSDLLDNSGQIVAGGGISLQIGKDLISSGLVQAIGLLELNAGRLVDVDGLLSSGGNLALSSVGGLRVGVDGAIFSAGNANLVSGADFANLGQVSAAGNLTISAVTGAINSGLIESGLDLRLASLDATIGGDVTALGRAEFEIGNRLDIAGQLSSIEGISLSANDVTLAANARSISGGGFVVSATGLVQLDGIVSAGDALSVSAAEIRNLGQVFSDSDISLLSGGNITQSGNVQAAGLLEISGRSISLVNENLGLTGVGITGTDVDVAGTLATNGQATVNADNLRIGGAIVGQTGLSLTASGLVELLSTGSVESAGEASIFAGNANIDGQFVSLGNFTANIQNDLAVAGAILSNAGLSIAVGGVSDIDGVINSFGAASLNLGQSASIAGQIASGASIALISGDLDIGGTLSGAGSITIGAASLGAGSTAAIISDSDVFFNILGDIDSSAIISSGGSISVQSGGLLSTSGYWGAAQSISIGAGSLDISGTLVADVDITLDISGSALLAGQVSAGGNTVIRASALSVLSTGQLVSAGDISIDALQSFDSAAIISGRNVLLASTGGISQSGDVFAEQLLSITAGSIENSGLIVGGDGLSLNAGNILASGTSDIQSGGLTNIVASDRLSLEGSLLSVGAAELRAGNLLSQNAQLVFADSGRLLSGGNLINNGGIDAAGDLTITAFGVGGTGNILTNGTISISADAGGLNYDGYLAAVGNIGIASAGDALLGGQVDTNALLEIFAANLTVQDAITAIGGLDVQISGDLTLNADGSIRSGAALNLVLANLYNAGLISSAAGLNVTAADSVTSNILAANTDITLDIGGTFSSNTAIQAGGSITALVGGLAELSGVVSAEGLLSIAAGDLDISGSVAADGRLSLISANDINIGVDATVYSVDDILLDAGRDLSNAGLILSDTGLEFLIGRDLSNSGIIQGAGPVHLAAQNALLNGSIFGPGGLTLDIGVDLTVGGLLVSDADLSAVAGGNFDIRDGGQILSGGNILLRSNDLNHDGLVSAAGSLTVLVGNNLQALTGSFESGNDLSINSGFANLGGDILSNADINIAAIYGPLAISANVGGTNVVLSAGTDLQLSGGSNIEATGAAAFSAQNNILADGSILANAGIGFLATTGGATFGSSALVRSGDGIAVQAAAFNNAGIGTFGFEADGEISVAAASIASGRLVSNGAIILGGSNGILLNGEINSAQTVIVRGNGGGINISTDGDIRSGSNIDISAGQAITNSGIIVAETDLAIAGSSIFSDGTIVAQGSDLSLTAPELNLAGTIFSFGNLALNGSDIVIGGEVASEQSLTINNSRAALTIADTGLLQSNAGLFLNLDTLAVDGSLRSLGSSSITANDVSVSNLIESGGTLSINVANALTSDGIIASVGGLDLQGSSITLNGLLSSEQQIGIVGGSLLVRGNVEANGVDIAVSSADFIGANAALTSVGGIAVNTASFNNEGLVQAQGAISVTGTASVSNSGSIHSNAGLTVVSGGLANLTGAISSIGALSVDALQVILGSALADGNVDIVARNGSINISGDVISESGRLSLSAAGNSILVNSGAELYALANIDLAGRAITSNGIVRSPGNVGFNATDTISINGQLVSGGTATLATNGIGGPVRSITVSASGQIDAGNIVINSPNLNLAGAIRANGTVGLNAVSSANFNGEITAGGGLTFTGANNPATGRFTDVTIGSAGQLISGGALQIGNTGRLIVNGLLSAASDLTVSYSTEFDIGSTNGRVEAGRDAIFNYTGASGLTANISDIDGDIVVGRNLTLNNGVYDVSGLVYAVNNFNLNSNGFRRDGTGAAYSFDVSGNGIVAAGGNLDISVIGGLSVGSLAAIQANGNISLRALNHVIAGDVIAGGTLSFTNRNDISGQSVLPTAGFTLTGSAQSGGNLSILSTTGGGNITLGSGSLLLSNGQLLASGSNISALGTIGSGSLVTLAASGNVQIGGLIQSGRRIQVDAGGSISVLGTGRVETQGNAQNIAAARDQGALANIAFSAGSNISNLGNIYSDGAITFRSNLANISNGGNITGVNDVVFQADNGSVNNSGSARSNSLALFQGQDFNNSGNFVANANLLISAPNIANTGLIGSGGSLTLTAAGNITNSGTIFAVNNLALNAGSQFHNDEGLTLALGNISITAPTVINDSARIESLGGDVNISTNSLNNKIKDLQILPGVGEPFSGLYYFDPAPVYVGPFDIVDCELSQLVCISIGIGGTVPQSVLVLSAFRSPISGIAYVAGGYTIGSGPSVGTVTANSGASQIVAARDINVNATAGTVVNSNSSIIAGRDIRINADTVNNVGEIVNVTVNGVPTPMPLPTVIQAGNNVIINANQLGNGTVVQNANFNGGNDQSPSTNVNGTNPQGGQGSSSQPGNQNGGLQGSAGSASGAGTASGADVANVAGTYDANGNAVSNSSGAGVGAGTVDAAIGAGQGIGSGNGQGNGISGNNPAGYQQGALDSMSGMTVNVAVDSSSGMAMNANIMASQDVAAANGVDNVGGMMSGVSANDMTVGVDMSGGAAAGPVGGVDQMDSGAAANMTGMGSDASNAQIVAGFSGIAIDGIIGSDGQAGQFIFDFLRQFDLVNSDGGFGFANGGRLFTYNDSPGARFLFTTARGFDELDGLFDSDYFFDQLDVDRNTHFIRLGDGFFESQLISQQVRAATAQAQLPQFGSALEQAQALMQSAVDQQAALGLQLGVALTAAQLTNLTESLVWWVSAQVNGHDVLVPVVYLAAADKKTIQNGALISGTNVAANIAGNINNIGSISATNIVSLTAGGDIVNSHGGTINGGTVVASAARDIINGAGSSITGGDILLSAGRDIVLESAKSTETSSSYTSGRKGRFTSEKVTTTTITGSEIAATGNLVLNAGRDIDINSSIVSAGGDAALLAGHDVNITGDVETVQTNEAWKKSKRNYGTSSSVDQTFVGSTVAAAGNLTVSAGNDIAIKGSELAAIGSVGLQAGNEISITSGIEQDSANFAGKVAKRKTVTSAETSTTNVLSNIVAGENLSLTTPGAVTIAGGHLAAGDTASITAGSVSITGVIDTATFDEQVKKKKKGFLSKKTTTTTTSIVDQEVVSSTVEGDKVLIGAVGDISIKGSNIVGTGDVVLNAGGAIDIGTVETTDTSDQTVKVKKSGFGISGAGVFAGVAKTKTISENTAISNTGSLVGSSDGNVTINAGGALTVTGSQVVSPGNTTLIGDSVTIENATDVEIGRIRTKSSSIGVTAGIKSPILSGVQSIVNSAKVAAGSDDGRTQAVAAVAGGLAVKNTVDALNKAGGIDALKDPKSLGSISVSVGFSKSKSEFNSRNETIVGSTVSGGNVSIVATGQPADPNAVGGPGSITVTGSQVTAGSDLLLAANGAITLQSAQEVDTTSSKNKSSGGSIGISIGASIVPEASFNFGKGNGSTRDVTNVETIVAAGGTATVTTPGALTLEGAQLNANAVNVDVGSLSIISQQDSKEIRSKQTGFSISTSGVPGVKAGLSASGSFNSSSERGNFVSVNEQSGINAGAGGFNINVDGATNLVGGVISSTADPSLNQLTTGTLTASDIQNREKYSASSIGLSGSFSGLGGKDSNGKDTKANFAPGTPVAVAAWGGQSGVTQSAIAPGTINITSGDAASQNVAATISRDTSTANAGALIQEFDAARRAEIQEGFAVTKELVQQTSLYFENRAKEEEDARKKAEAAKNERDKYPMDSDQYKEYDAIYKDQLKQVQYFKDNFGSASPARIIATALTGAASGNVAGSFGDLVRATAANVLQSLAATEVKKLVNHIDAGDDASEGIRAALQAVVACGGNVAGGGGDCSTAAVGASAGVALNYLITHIDQTPRDINGDGVDDPLTTQQQQEITKLITSIVTGVSLATGLDPAAANLAAQIEAENNSTRSYRLGDGTIVKIADAGDKGTITVREAYEQYGLEHETLARLSRVYKTTDIDELEAIVTLLGAGQTPEQIMSILGGIEQEFGKGSDEARNAIVDIAQNRVTLEQIITQNRKALGLAPPSTNTPPPTPYIAGNIAKCSYDASCTGTQGYSRIDPSELGLDPTLFTNDNGFSATLYRNGDRIILSFAGTDGLSDVDDDVLQALGLSAAQYELAGDLARAVSLKVGEGSLEFVGHSLGGGLAALASGLTGHPAQTFNAAPLNLNTIVNNGLNENSFAGVDNYSVRGDPVTASALLPGQQLAGVQHPLGSIFQYTLTTGLVGLYYHKVDTVLNYLGTDQ